MNRLECPECGRPSYCASLIGPLHCAYDECGTLILPGGDLDASSSGRRHIPRLNAETEITIEYLAEDRRVVERKRPFLDVSIVGISTVLDDYPAIGSKIVIELSNAAEGGAAWRVHGVVREITPADDDGYRVGIELQPFGEEQ